MFKIIVHSDLGNQDNLEIGWSAKFVPKTISASVLEKLSCIEVQIDDLKDDETLCERARRWLSDVAWSFSTGELGQEYLILCDYKPNPKSRLKSHKGIFPSTGTITKSDSLVVEMDWESESYLLGIAKITETNRNECFLLARDVLRSFVLVSKHPTLEAVRGAILVTIVECLDFKGTIVVKYHELIPRLVQQENVLCTFRMDTCGAFVNMSVFVDDASKGKYLAHLEAMQTRFAE